MIAALICIFIVGYVLIAMENWTRINKTAVALLMAVFSWVLLYWAHGDSVETVSAFTKALGETSLIHFSTSGGRMHGHV